MLGARVHTFPSLNGAVTGTSFAVWAPGARGVRVVGDFNHWDGRAHPMRTLGSSGVWELFVPGIGDGTTYKFEILGADGVLRQKADPLAFATEHPPRTGSVVFTPDYTWNDGDWMTERAASTPAQPADVALRGAPRLVEAGPQLRPAGRRARRVRRSTSASPTSSSCR